jgi:radical SAM protein with 4Fe4S-binding SPASM domain
VTGPDGPGPGDAPGPTGAKRRTAFGDAFWLQWHLTDACNLDCRHCYRERGTARPERSREELDDVLRRFRRFLDGRGLRGRLQLCGGEPLLARGLLPLARAAHELAIPCRVLSNGTLATPEVAAGLREAGVTIVQVSLDGGRERHDAWRGAGAFDRAVAGARHRADAGLEVTVAATLARPNADQIGAVIDAAHGAGARRVAFSRLVPQGAGAALREAGDLLSPDEWLAAQVTMLETARRRGIALLPRDPTFTPLLAPRGADACGCAVSGCAAGLNGLAVEPDGTAYPCRRLPIPVGNVFEASFEELWRSPVLDRLRRRDDLGGACGACHLRWLCGGCRAVAYALAGDPMAADPQCPLRASARSRAWSWARRRWYQARWDRGAPSSSWP